MATFDIKNKIALITGGAQGLGLKYALALLDEGARAVTLADINEEQGRKAVSNIEEKYGKGKAIFVVCNVIDKGQFEDAFKRTIETFQNVDILINNAGILNDGVWEKEVAINVNGVINGILLGLDNYIPKYKSGPEGLIINISSIAGLRPFDFIPIYTGTKFAVHGLSLSWGQPGHYERTKVKVIGVCPGVTDTALIQDISGRNLGPAYQGLQNATLANIPIQTPNEMADGLITIIKKAPTGTIWVVDKSKPFKFEIPDYVTMEKQFLE